MISLLVETNCNECPNKSNCLFLKECNIEDYLFYLYSYCLTENQDNCLRKQYKIKHNVSPQINYTPDGKYL